VYFSKSSFPLFVTKNVVFVHVPLNANELLLPTPFPEEGRAFTVSNCFSYSSVLTNRVSISYQFLIMPSSLHTNISI